MKIKKFLEENGNLYTEWLNNNNFGGIHIKILNFLKEIENGFFVETGSHDGIFQSNTKILEDLGWNGILIEPSENLYNECKKNRNCIVENYALVSNVYDKKFIKSDYSGNLLKKNEGILLMGEDPDNQCPTITFTELAKKHGIKKIDVFFLDVEGYELEVLKGIDLKNLQIDRFVIEVNLDFFSLDFLNSFMDDFGYKNVCNLSNFTIDNCPTWPKNHQDYLYIK